MGFFKKIGNKIKKGLRKVKNKIIKSPIATFAVGAGIGILGSALVSKLRTRSGNPTVSPAGRSFASSASKILQSAQDRASSNTDVIGGLPEEGRAISGESPRFRPSFKTAAFVIGGIGLVGALFFAATKL